MGRQTTTVNGSEFLIKRFGSRRWLQNSVEHVYSLGLDILVSPNLTLDENHYHEVLLLSFLALY